MFNKVLIIGLVLSMVGCAVPSVKMTTYNEKTGLYKTESYTKIFEGTQVLIPDHVELHVTTELKRKGLESQELEKSDKVDWSKANFNVVVSSISEQNEHVRLESILYVRGSHRDYILNKVKNVVLIPNSSEQILLENISVNTKDTQINLVIVYTTGTKRHKKSIRLKRLTVEDLKSRRSDIWEKLHI